MNVSKWYLTVAATTLACGFPPAQAASPVEEGYVQVSDASPYGHERIETVTVTARHRTESAQDVGIALSVLSDDDMAKKGIETVNQLQFAVPSFEAVPAFGSGQPEFRLRGVGFDDYGSNNSSTVGIYIDDVAYPVPASTQSALFDIERVEVLRGPQGTLYGRNTTGGAVNFITNQPTDDWSAAVSADYDSHNAFRGEGSVSGPLGGDMKFRLAAVTEQGGAWQKNRDTGESLGDKNTAAFRGILQWTPSDAVDIRLNAHWGYDKSEPNGLYLFSDYTAYGLSADTDSTRTGWGSSAVFANLVGIDADARPFRNSINQGLSLHGDFDLGAARLTVISAYTAMHRREFNDWDASSYAYAGTYFDTRANVFSQEMRLADTSDGPLHWLIGAYYSNEELDEIFDSDFMDLYAFATETSYRQYVQAIAGFAQIEYRLSERLTLSAGLRGEREVRKQKDYVTDEILEVGGDPIAMSDPADKSLRKSPLTGKAEAKYRLQDNVMWYASVSRGVKSGGFTAYNVPSASAVSAFKPESLWAFETGVKSDLFDGTLRLNASAFYYDYRDQQVQSAIYTHDYGVIGAIVNADRSHLYGGELEATWHPLPELTITQNFGYKTGKFDKFSNFLDTEASISADATVTKSLKGKKVGFPPVSYSGSVSYSWQVGDYALEPEFNYVFHDKRKPLLLGSTYDIDAYWLANASLTLSPENGPWEITVYGRNIFDTKYDLERNYFISNINIALRGEPASAGVRLKYRY